MKNTRKFLLGLLLVLVLAIFTCTAMADSVGAQVIGAEISEEGDGYKYSYGVGAGDLEAEYHANAGEYVIRKPNGEVIGGYGVNAGVSATGKVAEIEGSCTAGDKEYNMHASGNAGVGVARGTAEMNVGMVNGDFNAVIRASGELNAAEISGTAGATIGGVDVNVSGGLKVGIGGNASVGYQNGKLDVSFGASLGVGFNVGVSVDVKALAEKTAMPVATSVVKTFLPIVGWFF